MANLLESEELKNLLKAIEKNKQVIACILFGSYAKGKQKPNSDIDICIIKDKNSKLGQFSDINGFSIDEIDLHYFNNFSDVIKFRIFIEGKILILKDKKKYMSLRRKFLHSYRGNYLFYERNMKRLLENV